MKIYYCAVLPEKKINNFILRSNEIELFHIFSFSCDFGTRKG